VGRELAVPSTHAAWRPAVRQALAQLDTVGRRRSRAVIHLWSSHSSCARRHRIRAALLLSSRLPGSPCRASASLTGRPVDHERINRAPGPAQCADAPSVARRAVLTVLDGWGFRDEAWLNAARVVVSEMVSSAVLDGGLNEAVRRGHLARNPAVLAKAPRLVEAEIAPYSVEEI
jgi:hypothetical protein